MYRFVSRVLMVASLVLLPAAYRGESGPPTEPRELADDDWRRFVETSNRLGRLAQERFGGRLKVIFHSHADSHAYRHTDPHANPYAHTHADPHRDADAHPDGHAAIPADRRLLCQSFPL